MSRSRDTKHRCGKRRRGRPKVGYGACFVAGGYPRPGLQERRRDRVVLEEELAMERG